MEWGLINMAGEYINPASMFADPDQFKVGGRPNFMSGMVAAQRQQQATPFLDMAKQQMQQQTQTGEQTLQEFMSPQGQETRKAQRQQIIDEGDVYSRTKDSRVAQENEKGRLAPFMTDKQIEDAKLGAEVARHELHSEPIKYFSGVFEHLSKVPEEQRKSIYDTLVKTSGYNTNNLPEDLKSYQGSTMGHLAAARYAQVHTPQQEQKLAQEQVPAEAQRDVARIQEAGKLAVINRQIAGGVYGDLGRQTGVLEKALRTGIDPDTGKPMDQEGKQATQESLKRIRSKNVMDFVTKQTEMERLAKMIGDMSGDPVKQKAANDAYEAAHQAAWRRGLQLEGMSPEDFSNPTGAAPKQGKVDSASVTKAFGKYEPDKYDYRVGPGGTLQRAVKVK